MTRHTAWISKLLAALTLAVLPAGAAFASQPVAKAFGFQPAATDVMEHLSSFHNIWLLGMCVVIVVFVTLLLLWVMVRFNKKANPTPSTFHHNTMLEVAWTAIPILILVMIAIPSFQLLAEEEIIPESEFTIKAVGAQWRWDYEYPDHGGFFYTANMMSAEEAAAAGKPRLLAATEPVVVPVGVNVRIIVTADDVIHSWAIPAFGVKKDAVPGRLNETWFNARKEGIYYGQCSELCGARHAFMPIEVHVVSRAEFDAWIKSMQEEYGSADEYAPVQFAQNQ